MAKMNAEFDSILEQSLSQISAGKARVESCLVSYPAVADQLEPLLRVAEVLRAVPKPTLSPEAQARIEARVLGAAKRNPRLRVASVKRLGGRFLPLRWALGAFMVLLLLMIVSAGLIRAAADSVPGTPLYHVKLVVEDVWLWLTPASQEPELHLQLARRRMEELEVLAAQGVFDAAVLTSMSGHMEVALIGAESLPAAQAVQLLDELVILAQEQEVMLAGLAETVPAASRQRLAFALQTVTAQAGRARTLREILSGRLLATSTATVTATASLMPTLTGLASGTVTPTATGTGKPTALPSPSASLEPTPSPGQEPTQAAPQRPTDVPVVPTGTSPPNVQPLPTATPLPSEVAKPTKQVPPGLTKTAEPPAHGLTKTPSPGKP